MSISNKGLNKIRRLLNLSCREKFPRCSAKSRAFVKRCEAKGDFSHSNRLHRCDECRCQETAGHATGKNWGDYYGIGEQTGHFGVGYCRMHEKGRYGKVYEKFLENQISVVRSYGKMALERVGYQEVAKIEAKEARQSDEIRQSLVRLEEYITGFIDKMKNDSNLTGGVNKSGGMTPMTDYQKASMICEMMKTVSKLALDRFTIEKVDMIHIDDIKVRIPRIIGLGKECIEKAHSKGLKQDISTDDIKAEYIDGLRDIFTSIKKL